MTTGKLIVIEGIDGTGKSTQARMLAAFLEARGMVTTLGYEPTEGPFGKRLRESAHIGRLTPQQELQLFIADRKEHVRELISPALAAGKIVILDRYYFSNMAYQGARGIDPQEIRQLNEAFAPVPDLLVILDLQIDLALQRIGHRGDTGNAFEQRENLLRCQQIYRSLISEPFAKLITTNDSVENISNKICKLAEEYVIRY